VPDYQVSFDLYENGVATGLVLDYGSFALAGKLADLSLSDASECP
jgi:EipB-like